MFPLRWFPRRFFPRRFFPSGGPAAAPTPRRLRPGARRDRDGQFTRGHEQWHLVSPGCSRLYRHTFAAVGPDGLLDRLRDEPGWSYVGVAGAAIYEQGPGGTSPAGVGSQAYRRCPVLQSGELTFHYGGANGQAAVGFTAYCLDDETVVDDPSLTMMGYAVGRITQVLSGAQEGLCRVLIDGPAALPGLHVETLPPFTLTVAAGDVGLVRLGFSARGRWPDGGYWLWCPPSPSGTSTPPPGVVVSPAVNGQDGENCCLVVQVAPDCGDYAHPTLDVVISPVMRGWGWTPGTDPDAVPVRVETGFTCAEVP